MLQQALFEQIRTSEDNMEKQKQRALDFVNLVLYNDELLRAETVNTLYRHFNRWGELKRLMTTSTLVLEEQDRDTLKFVAKQKMKLNRSV